MSQIIYYIIKYLKIIIQKLIDFLYLIFEGLYLIIMVGFRYGNDLVRRVAREMFR